MSIDPADEKYRARPIVDEHVEVLKAEMLVSFIAIMDKNNTLFYLFLIVFVFSAQENGYQSSHGPSILLVKKNGSHVYNASAKLMLNEIRKTERLEPGFSAEALAGNHRNGAMKKAISVSTPDVISRLRLHWTDAMVYAGLSNSLARYDVLLLEFSSP